MTEIHAYVCSHVFLDTRPVLLVAREDGDWMFLCGQPHGPDQDYHLVGMNHLLERDASLGDVVDLDVNSEAEREAVGGIWLRVDGTNRIHGNSADSPKPQHR